jgi:prolipoprotein diacylglyceryl transferase
MMLWQGIPSPASGVWYLGPFPLRAYALAIIIGIVVAVWLGDLRWRKVGGAVGEISDIAVWAIPFGIIGGRIYHVITDPQLYFSKGADPIAALRIWEGGLGIWGAISFGALGVWIAARRREIYLGPLADSLAPGIVLAQAIGRWGNYFNQELYGSPTELPWGLEIAIDKRPFGYDQFETFHPTFLYESIWCVVVAVVLISAERRYQLRNGRVFVLYFGLYAFGRLWIEQLRIDPVNVAAGLRINTFTAIFVIMLAVYLFRRLGQTNKSGTVLYRGSRE